MVIGFGLCLWAVAVLQAVRGAAPPGPLPDILNPLGSVPLGAELDEPL